MIKAKSTHKFEIHEEELVIAVLLARILVEKNLGWIRPRQWSDIGTEEEIENPSPVPGKPCYS